MNERRVRLLRDGGSGRGPIVYWMSRDQRTKDNWALVFAQEQAVRMRRPLVVVFCLVSGFLNAGLRQYVFMVKGLMKVERRLAENNIPFRLLQGPPGVVLTSFCEESHAGLLVTDFDPLMIKRQWKDSVREGLGIPIYEVDAHNVVPCWVTSQKAEFGAYTIRPKILRVLDEFLDRPRSIRRHRSAWDDGCVPTPWDRVLRDLPAGHPVEEAKWIEPGEEAGLAALRRFITTGLERYEKERSDPSKEGQSNLSPYLHFGQLSAQRVACQVRNTRVGEAAREAFLEELIVRRELSDNFCLYNPAYASIQGFPRWAAATLDHHRSDRRDYVYNLGEFEKGMTHDELWNAAQLEMVRRGKMHGYMRMYWAKKILEWTESPEQAMDTAIHLNDKYELDGRDPNGYAGIAWSIGGVHDRPWGERAVFGKIRYMSYNGCKRKFDVGAYIEKVRDFS